MSSAKLSKKLHTKTKRKKGREIGRGSISRQKNVAAASQEKLISLNLFLNFKLVPGKLSKGRKESRQADRGRLWRGGGDSGGGSGGRQARRTGEEEEEEVLQIERR